MAVTRISAETMPPQFSSDGGTTYKTLVCVKDWSLTGATTTNETETFCGKFTSTGVPGMTGSANAVANTTPTSGTEVSAEDALGWWVGKTALKFKAQYPSTGTPGSDLYIQGDALITNFSLTGTAGNDVEFSVDWAIQGTVDNTP